LFHNFGIQYIRLRDECFSWLYIGFKLYCTVLHLVTPCFHTTKEIVRHLVLRMICKSGLKG